jgi:NAD(P)-dependent dehydrogenase (short-subunit alcohol dehydrogenase family)
MNSVLIIGGTSGLGYSTGLNLAERGYKVTLAGRSRPKKLGKASYKFIDVTDELSIKDFFSSGEVEPINSIIYSAGVSAQRRPINQFAQQSYNNVLDVNLLGALLVFKYAHKYLKKTKGRVLVINSVAARSYSKYSGIEYSISKSGLSGAVRHLAVEWSEDGILINSIFPSMMDTAMLRKALSKKHIEGIAQDIPLRRIANSDDMLGIIEFLISTQNTYLTGAGIDINGGQHLTG